MPHDPDSGEQVTGQSLRVMLDVGESKRQSACQFISANLSILTVLARHASA